MKKRLLGMTLVLTIIFTLFSGINVIGSSVTKGFGLVTKYDDMEGYDVGAKFTWSKPNSVYDFHSYGNYSKIPVASDEVAYSGNKSVKFSQRCDRQSSFKMINLFEPTMENVGTTYDISFKVYADKNAGVYKNSGKSVDECVPFTDEELKKSEGTFINLVLAGPDGDNYKYRSGYGNPHASTFVKWNEWTEISTQFTFQEKFVDDGNTGKLKNPAVNAIRVYQSTIDYSLNEGLCDTFYIDDVTVQKAGAMVSATSSNLENTEINIHTDFYKPSSQYKAKSIACEYLDGRLINIKAGNVYTVNTTAHVYPLRSSFSMTKKYKESDVVVYVMSSDYANPICRPRKVSLLPQSVVQERLDNIEGYAEEVIKASTATYKDAIEGQPVIDGNKYYRSTDGSYTQSSDANNTRFNESLVVRKTCDSYVKFSVPDKTDKVAYAYLRMYTKKLSNDNKPGTIEVYETGNDWEESKLTHNNAPKLGKKIAELYVDNYNVPYYFDITDYINEVLPQGKTEYTFALSAEGNTYMSFIPERSTAGKYYKPSLIFEGVGKTKEQCGLSAFNGDKFVDVLHTTDEANTDPCDKESVRVLSSLTDFTPKTSMPNLSQYGGWIDGGKYKATGFFRTELIDGRWWFIDPLGYKYIDMGVAQTQPKKGSQIQTASFESKYGTDDVWKEKIGEEFRSYGFNGMGPWSDFKLALTSEKPLTQAVFKKAFLQGFDKDGWSQDGVMEVFSPNFETYCEKIAEEQIAPYADNPYIVGWYTDNEPPAGNNMLKNTLSKILATSDDYYDYAVAWKWFRMRKGENATIKDVTAQDNEEWIEFAYDRYMQVITRAIRKYDKNHMIFGGKLDKNNRGMFRAVGRYADAIGYDYYPNAFTPDRMVISEWYKWSGKPMMNAEWYSKGRDACDMGLDIINVAGVGYEVPTQKDRGYYYQAFAIGMLDSNVFTGWQWFKYMDNDPTDLGQDLSNINANKGLIKRTYEYWDEFLSMIKEININAYNIANYLDK